MRTVIVCQVHPQFDRIALVCSDIQETLHLALLEWGTIACTHVRCRLRPRLRNRGKLVIIELGNLGAVIRPHIVRPRCFCCVDAQVRRRYAYI